MSKARLTCALWTAAAIALFGAPAMAAQEPVRLLLSIGSNYGSPDDQVLQFAEEDASRVRDVFVELGGVTPGRAMLLARPKAEQVREKLAEITGRVSELHSQEKTVALFVFISSHGKNELLHLAGTELPVESLRALVRDTKADLRVVIVDACDSGIAPRSKGASKGPAYALSMQAPSLSGEVFISSSGPHEPAQEWDALGGSLFTHHLLAGLRGDADFDADGKVSLMEAYTYAAHRTVAESLDVGQHPQFDLGLTGANDLIVTELSKSSAHVVLDAQLEGRFVLASLPKPEILIELLKVKGKQLTLAVPPGSYLLRQTAGFRVALQELDLSYGGSMLVDGREFETRDYAEVAMKGEGPEFHPHALELSFAEATAPISSSPMRWYAGAAYRYSSGRLWARAAFNLGHMNYHAVQLQTHEWRFAARAAAGYRFWLGPLLVIPAGAVELSLLRQSYLRDEEGAILQSYPPIPAHFTTGFAVGPQLWIEAPLPASFFIAASATLWLRTLPADDQPTATLGAEAEIALGIHF